MSEAVERRARRPWYRRMLHMGRTRTFAVVLAALVVATPAVGAASGWFSFGQPNVPPPAKPGYMFGLEKPGSSRLLSLRVADPQGGPPWGLRIVKTSRDDTCLQLGRVEDGELGSLGIDGAWNDDKQFHAISVKDDAADQCGSTDAAGYGYVNRGILGAQASANVKHQGSAQSSQGCTPPQYLQAMHLRHPLPLRVRRPAATPGCSARVIFFGLLGPDAVSVTYRKPGGALATERTYGGVGAYLLVFPYDEATCYEYSHSPHASQSCDSTSMGGVSPPVPGAVTKITYKDGHSCSLAPSAKLEAAYEAFERRAFAKLGRPRRVEAARNATMTGAKPPEAYVKWAAAYRRLLARFLAREHLTQAQFRDGLAGPDPSCPAVGWVASTAPKVTRDEVSTPIAVKELPSGRYGCPNKLKLPGGCGGVSSQAEPQVPVEWSFTARKAVTNSGSWYEWWVAPTSSQTKPNCGGESFDTFTNIRQGQRLRYSTFFPTWCRGSYEILVGFVPFAPPGRSNAGNTGGGLPGHDGSILVGRASFKIR